MLKKDIKYGVRIRISDKWKGGKRDESTGRHGTIVGETRFGIPIVLLDGNKTKTPWNQRWLELLPEEKQERPVVVELAEKME